MYALIKNGVATRYPYSPDDLRKDNPQVSFPKVISDDTLTDNGVVAVSVQPQPTYDIQTQRVETSNLPSLIDGVWTITKTVVAKKQEQIDADTANKAVEVRNKRNGLLAGSDWTQGKDIDDAISASWAVYREALRNVPQQVGFPWGVNWPVKPE